MSKYNNIIMYISYSVTKANSTTTVNITLREICFFSSFNNCSLVDLTQYSVSIVDISGVEIFAEETVPESKCLTVDQLALLPQCGPFLVTTKPFNDYIIYNQEIKEVSLG